MESRDQFSLLPYDVKQFLRYQFLQGNSIFTLAKVSKEWHNFYIASDAVIPREEGRRIEFLDKLRKLLSHSALGEWGEASLIWEPLPRLLKCRGMVYHPNPKEITFYMHMGRYKFELTAWQIAWVNEEYDVVEKMAAHMDAEDKQSQFDEIFPHGNLIKYDWDLEVFKALLEALFEAIKQDELINDDNLDLIKPFTREKLCAVYDYLNPAKYKQIGLVSDPLAYEAALDIFDNNWRQLEDAQRVFWNIRVEEAIASTLGTGYLRPHSQGIDNEPLNAGCILANESSILPFRRFLDSVAGFHFRVNISGDIEMARTEGEEASLSNLIEQNRSKGAKLMREYSHNSLLISGDINSSGGTNGMVPATLIRLQKSPK